MKRNSGWISSIIGSVCLLSSVSGYAAISDPTYRWQAVFNLGLQTPFNKQSNDIITSPEGVTPVLADVYQGQKAAPTPLLSVGIQRNKIWNNHGLHWGLQLDVSAQQKQKGVIYESGDPNIDSNSYEYYVARQTLLATVQWDILQTPAKWQPYVVAGLGFSENRTSSYSQSLVVEDSVPQPAASQGYSSKTIFNAAFEAGLGLSHAFSETWLGQAQYVYLNAGKAKLGTSSVDPPVAGPNQNMEYGVFTLGAVHRF